MKAIAGAFRRHRRGTTPPRYLGGYAMLGLILVLFGLVLIGVIIAPNLILKVVEKNRDVEQKRITRVGNSLADSIQRRLVIPTYTNSPAAVTPFAGMDLTEVQQVNSSFSADTNLKRVADAGDALLFHVAILFYDFEYEIGGDDDS